MHGNKGTRRQRLLLAFLATLMLSACAASEGQISATPPPERAAVVFAVGYGGIAEKYLEPKTIRELAIEGLEGLSDADPSLAFEERGGLLRLTRNGRLLRVGVAPGPQNLDCLAALSADFLAVSLANRETEAKAETYTAAMFQRVLHSLDRYSRYAGGRTAIRQREKRKGYSGAGLQVHRYEESFVVTEVIPKSPAEKAGIRPSDEILKIGAVPTAGLDLPSLMDRLRGPVNSKLFLTLKRRGVSPPLSVTLNRQQVFMPTIRYARRNAIAYLRIRSFNRDTARSLARHLAKIEAEQAVPQGIVLDLRGNPGGLMDQAIAVADLFLKSGRIITTRGRHPSSNQIYNAVAGDAGTGVPIVVLLNGKSASSAEIVAAALHDQHRALVVGSRSYGKGSVQTILPLPDGAEITLTWSRIYTPDGNPLNDAGVGPNVCTAGSAEKDRKALEVLASLARTRKTETACPSLRTESPLDLPIAEALLKDAGLYASLLEEAPEEIANKEGALKD